MRRYCWVYGGAIVAFGLGVLVGGLLSAELVKWILGVLCICAGVMLIRR